MKLVVEYLHGETEFHIYGKCGYMIEKVSLTGKTSSEFIKNLPNVDIANVKHIKTISFSGVKPVFRMEP